MQEFKKDNTLAELMKKSIIKMPFSDFEDNVIRKIEAEAQTKSSIHKSINISLLFFVLGTGAGAAVCLFLPDLLSSINGISIGRVLLIFQAVFILTVLTQIDKLFKLVKEYGSI